MKKFESLSNQLEMLDAFNRMAGECPHIVTADDSQAIAATITRARHALDGMTQALATVTENLAHIASIVESPAHDAAHVDAVPDADSKAPAADHESDGRTARAHAAKSALFNSAAQEVAGACGTLSAALESIDVAFPPFAESPEEVRRVEFAICKALEVLEYIPQNCRNIARGVND